MYDQKFFRALEGEVKAVNRCNPLEILLTLRLLDACGVVRKETLHVCGAEWWAMAYTVVFVCRVQLPLIALRRNFEKAAHEVIAASKRHQSHATASCLSFLKKPKPLDELSVSHQRR